MYNVVLLAWKVFGPEAGHPTQGYWGASIKTALVGNLLES
jgi:hypothetical protein